MADQIDNLIKLLKLDMLDSNESLSPIQQKSGLRPSQLAFALIIFLLIILIIAQASTLIICIGCYLFPAYFTLLSLQERNHDKNVKYLTYWIIFTICQIFAGPAKWIFGNLVYTLGRVGITVLLLHPAIGLAQKIYESGIGPAFRKYQSQNGGIVGKINRTIGQGVQKFQDVRDKIKFQ